MSNIAIRIVAPISSEGGVVSYSEDVEDVGMMYTSVLFVSEALRTKFVSCVESDGARTRDARRFPSDSAAGLYREFTHLKRYFPSTAARTTISMRPRGPSISPLRLPSDDRLNDFCAWARFATWGTMYDWPCSPVIDTDRWT